MNKKKLLSSVLLTSLVVGSLAACASSDDGAEDSTDEGGGIVLTTEVPAAVGEVDSIDWNLGFGEPESLDPSQSALEKISTVVGNLCESLTRFDQYSDSPLPNLAETVEQPDDQTFVISLREGATFWDGSPVTADDVKFSLERIKNPDTASSWASAYDDLDSITVESPTQLTVKFNNPNPIFQWFLATPAAAIVQKAFVEDAGSAFGTVDGGVMCSGPYKLDDWRSGQDITISAYEGYWDTERQPMVKEINFSFVTDAAAATASLLTGDIDGQWTVPSSGFDQLMSSDGNLLFGGSYSPVFISGFTFGPAMQYPEIRKAISYLLDRDAIADSVYAGAAMPIRTKTPPATWGYGQDIYQEAWDAFPTPTFDIEKAKEIAAPVIDEAPPMTIAYNADSDELAQVAVALESAAQEAGIKMELKSMPPAEYFLIFSDPSAREGIDGYLVRGYLDFPEPLTYDMYRVSGHYYNYGEYSNPEFDDLILEAAKTLDDEERAKLVTQAEAIQIGEAYDTPIVSPYTNLYVGEGLTGVVPWPGYLYSPWAVALGAAE